MKPFGSRMFPKQNKKYMNIALSFDEQNPSVVLYSKFAYGGLGKWTITA